MLNNTDLKYKNNRGEMGPKKLLDLTKEEQEKFLESFDVIFTDVDGVLWDLWYRPIEGNADTIKTLRKLGKKVYLITNNSTAPLDVFMGRVKSFEPTIEEVVRPSNAFIWYLDSINFDKTKEVYVVGFQALRDQIAKAGYKVKIEQPSTFVTETLDALSEKLNDVDPNVGAVILDYVINVDYMGLQKCVQYIQRNNAVFLTGATDSVIPYRGSTLIGSINFAKAIEVATNVKPKILSKPGKEFKTVLENHVGSVHPTDPKRILFIGDSVETDLAFADECGYQKMLVLSGYVKEESLEKWKWDEKFKPDYVADKLSDILTAIKMLGMEEVKP